MRDLGTLSKVDQDRQGGKLRSLEVSGLCKCAFKEHAAKG